MAGEETAKKPSKELEVEIKKVILARVPDFKAQADLLTFEGVRRAVEKDLGMKPFSLDTHKKFIKRCLEEYFSADDGEKAPKPSESTKSNAEKSTKEEPEETQISSELKNEDASNFDETHASDAKNKIKKGDEVSEDMIKEAIKKRAPFFKENNETINLLKVRRLLEEDLNLGIKALDAHKVFISKELEKVLKSLEMNESENDAQKNPKKAPQKVEEPQKANKTSKRTREEAEPSDNASDEEELSEEVKPKRRKQAVAKVRASTKNPTTQKNLVDEKMSIASLKSKKNVKKEREESSDEGREGVNSSEKSGSRSSGEEKKKGEKPIQQVYGRKVEHLKSIIKSCGASIPPAAYRRAKQAPEEKREAVLIKELEEILEKEGLSANPSEKEIKEVKKRKERAKELEGIDTSNIITSSRRRSAAFSFIPPPKPPKIDSSSDDDDDEEDDDDDDDDVVMEKVDVNDDDGGDGGNDDDGGDDGNDDDGGDEGNDDDGGDDGKGNDDDGDEGKESGKDEGDDSNLSIKE